MSALITTQMSYSGVSLYAIIRDILGLVANGSGLESYNVANYATYKIAMTEQSPTGYFTCAMPSYLARGKYIFSIHQGTGIAGDLAVSQGFIDWNGSTEDYLDLIISKIPPNVPISGFDPLTDLVNLYPNQSGVTIGTVNALGPSAAASVKTQIDTSLGTDAMPELTGVPSATPAMKTAVMFLLMALRNKRTSTATTVGVYNSSGALITSAPQSDNGTTYTKDNFS